jgi:enoyl-CoA hydratase/carnithine racemase
VSHFWIPRRRLPLVYNLQMRDELFEIFSAIASDDEVHVLVLSGAVHAFCAGADLTEFGIAPSPGIARRARFGRDVWAMLDELPIPNIAALHGFAFGSGLELALFCDFCLAAKTTEFAFPEVHLGFSPAAAGTQTRARLEAGLLTGRRVNATEAVEFGLVNGAVPDEDLTAAVDELAAQLAAPTHALSAQFSRR